MKIEKLKKKLSHNDHNRSSAVSGKTTLAKSLFRNKPYVNLEAPDVRLKAELDPRGFLDQFKDGAVLDEIQRAPWLLSYIQSSLLMKRYKWVVRFNGQSSTRA